MTKKLDQTIVAHEEADEFDELDLTPARAQVRMGEDTYVAIKIICAMRQIMMREFYDEAFTALVEKRKEWDEEKQGPFLYRSPLRDGKLVSIAVFEHHFEEIDAVADQDGMYHRAAYFTAIMDHIDRMKEELDL